MKWKKQNRINLSPGHHHDDDDGDALGEGLNGAKVSSEENLSEEDLDDYSSSSADQYMKLSEKSLENNGFFKNYTTKNTEKKYEASK